MSNNVCPQCGAPLEPGAVQCKYCGEKIIQTEQARPTSSAATQSASNASNNGNYDSITINIPRNNADFNQAFNQGFNQQFRQTTNTAYYENGIDLSWPKKNKTVAALLAIFLGAFGIHKFYLGNTKMGIIYLLFFWTYIPSFIGFIEGIIYLCSSEHNFQIKHHVRVN